MSRISGTILAFDVGERRIGVAKAVVPPRIAQPFMTLLGDDTLEERLETLFAHENPVAVVVGLPRNQQGEKTTQTATVEAWAQQYIVPKDIPLYWQDESLTSVAAEAQLNAAKRQYQKADIDALAASIILDDFLERNESTGAST